MKKYLPFIALTIIFISCKVTLTPTKSVTVLTSLNQLQGDIVVLYNSISTASSKDFLNFQTGYQSVDTEIDSLIAFDGRRVKSKKLVTEDKNIQSLFDEYKNEHKAKVDIANSEIDVYNAYLKSAINIRLEAENSLP